MIIINYDCARCEFKTYSYLVWFIFPDSHTSCEGCSTADLCNSGGAVATMHLVSGKSVNIKCNINDLL